VYIPPHFNEERVEVLHQLIREHGLATLVTYGPSGLIASHVPLVLDTSSVGADADAAASAGVGVGAAHLGALRGHLSRANQQWRDYSPEVPALAIFAGPQHYITPSWYPAKAEHGKVVPTWNYIVVHAYGRLETYDDRESLLANVEALTTHHEAKRAEPWKVSDAPASYVDAQLKGIIGISLRIDRLEGKWKISQNRSAADQASVAAALHDAGSDASVAMAQSMNESIDESARRKR
jgi:transcriptional regulator